MLLNILIASCLVTLASCLKNINICLPPAQFHPDESDTHDSFCIFSLYDYPLGTTPNNEPWNKCGQYQYVCLDGTVQSKEQPNNGGRYTLQDSAGYSMHCIRADTC
ncbi:uncharacterized protein L969DRAFT_93890 [Mixia osmundae IAM 14324]|uniref:uncharacterized protein n=1 Tax=Mixia osmundae (strain CBS 9802 / IAM 14324 / JCM 22182 / KY 12970) TaxID=764103 RepID=UPI0004A5473A|nr:uncharacterized protein L969DRAFT_93890 [Mixia osmundae IAM 14324]KEI40061.1 hypothetical protein L969DRAFT_93890 [Mixia osmundae IAM 14324]